MIQPFVKFQKSYIDRLLKLKKIYLVTQTYKGIKSNMPRHSEIVITDYDDKGLALTHYKAIIGDKYAAVLNLTTEKHLDKLKEILAPESAYSVYWGVVKSRELLDKQIGLHYKDKMRKYIERNTRWRISRDTVVQPKLELIFGEFYINLKYGSERIKIKFEELEKY